MTHSEIMLILLGMLIGISSIGFFSVIDKLQIIIGLLKKLKEIEGEMKWEIYS